jgi:hypothetical protein
MSGRQRERGDVAGELDREPLIKPAQDREGADCLIREMQRRQWEP